jgi:4-amino-4-deoxy-L-arabinose transferase-like glycosyltransferase
MKLRSPILWFSLAAAALLGVLWYRSRQAVAAKSAESDQQRQTLRIRNWKLPWEENVTRDIPLLQSIFDLSLSDQGLLKKIADNTSKLDSKP